MNAFVFVCIFLLSFPVETFHRAIKRPDFVAWYGAKTPVGILPNSHETRFYSVDEAVDILDGKHVVLVGSSFVRYVYYILTYWLLHNGTLPPPTIYNGFLSKAYIWMDYFTLWQDKILYPHEICDCCRGKNKKKGLENHHFELQLSGKKIKITYINFSDVIMLRNQTLEKFLSLFSPNSTSTSIQCRREPSEVIYYTPIKLLQKIRSLAERNNGTNPFSHIIFQEGWKGLETTRNTSEWRTAVNQLTSIRSVSGNFTRFVDIGLPSFNVSKYFPTSDEDSLIQFHELLEFVNYRFPHQEGLTSNMAYRAYRHNEDAASFFIANIFLSLLKGGEDMKSVRRTWGDQTMAPVRHLYGGVNIKG